MAIRGTIEGFYGAPWSMEDRARHLDFLGSVKANTYVYSPKDDPFARDKWRDAYPQATLDALKTLSIPVIECHLSNPAAREDFRRHTYVSLAATGVVSGFGPQSYQLAVTAALGLIRERGHAAARSPQG